jgi:hypothetical protein
MTDKPKFDPSTWGQKPKSKKSKNEKVDLEEDEPKPKKDRKNPMEDQIKLLMDRIQQLESQKPISQIMIEKADVIAYIETEGSEGLKNWLFGYSPRKNELNFLTLMINHFLFK